MSRSDAHPRRRSALALGLLLAGLVLWLWPVGFGLRMPVGGDVTQFSIGLMAVLSRAIGGLRLPVWNDLWGYGFPGLAESQMGVYYPPHWVLYGLFPLEWAYTLSLVVHTLLGAYGAYWCARRLEVSPAGAALAGFAWATSGFYVIHLPHQWGYTVGCWMPWAWGLTWDVARGLGSRRTPFLLAAVLALQILPGHFQLAFYTEVGVLLLAIAGGAGRRGLVVTLAALAAVAPLAAMQVVPTLRLARLAAARRDYEYLSGFAASPVHLVSYVAPGLFQRSPLWRPLAWDPFHTSPEEHLAYVGLVPLFLAVGAAVRGFRKDPAVRALTVVALATVVFSLGPYIPGFDLWSRLPGFSFFRAPARWSVATGLALALLAGRGFDGCRQWARPGRSLVGFVVAAAAGPALVVAGVELALASTAGPGWPGVANAFDRGLNLLPWSRVMDPQQADGQGGRSEPPPTVRGLAELARQPQDDPYLRVRSALARQGIPWRGETRTFDRSRLAIYRQELGETFLIMAGMLAVAPWARRRSVLGPALVVLTAIDLCVVGHHRPIDVGPIRPLTEQSGVLARLARLAPGPRVADASRNLPMVARAAPISSYRTLDLPCVPALTSLAMSQQPGRAEALRASGAAVRVAGPFEAAAVGDLADLVPGWSASAPISDRALAGWLFGADWVAQQGPAASTFRLLTPPAAPAHAWLVPLTAAGSVAMLDTPAGRVDAVLRVLATAAPLAVRRPRPERLELDVEATGPGLVIVSQLADPQWRARWVGPGGTRGAEIRPAFAGPGEFGWQAVETPGPGRWSLHLDYDARDVRTGLAISLPSWGAWLLACLHFGRSRSAGHPQGQTS